MRECGLKHVCIGENKSFRCHSPCGSVDWNQTYKICLWKQKSHSPCGSVDWNPKELEKLAKEVVTPHAGVWIETGNSKLIKRCRKSLPMRECGLKHHCLMQSKPHWRSLPMRECGLKPKRARKVSKRSRSLPMRECGLKPALQKTCDVKSCHSPCGSVDWNKASIDVSAKI